MCPNGKIPSNFPIHSITWVNDNRLLLLHESHFLVARFVDHRLVHINDIVESYTFGAFKLNNASQLNAVFFFQWSNNLNLYMLQKNGQILIRGNDVNERFEVENNIMLVLDSQSNGVCLYENFSYDLRILMFDFQYQASHWTNGSWNKLQNIPYFTITKRTNSTNAFFDFKTPHNKTTEATESMFDKVPFGFIYNYDLYLIDMASSSVYIWDYELLKSHLASKSNFELPFQTIEIDIFFKCNYDPKNIALPKPVPSKKHNKDQVEANFSEVLIKYFLISFMTGFLGAFLLVVLVTYCCFAGKFCQLRIQISETKDNTTPNNTEKSLFDIEMFKKYIRISRMNSLDYVSGEDQEDESEMKEKTGSAKRSINELWLIESSKIKVKSSPENPFIC